MQRPLSFRLGKCGLILLAAVAALAPLSYAQERAARTKTLEERVAALENQVAIL